MKTNIARTFAALNATNEAILYAKSPEELYEKVCEAAFSSGDFLATAVFLLEPDTKLLRFAAGFGEDIARLRAIDISIVADTPEGSGVCGQAFRDQKVCISNDFLNDARSLAWRQGAAAGHVGAAAGLPLTCNGRSVGVFLVTRRDAGSIDAPIVALLERMSANLSFALDNFDHEAARKDGERAMRRLNRMFGAISATNEAILARQDRTGTLPARLRCRRPQRKVRRHGGAVVGAGLDLAEACRRQRRESRSAHAARASRSIPTMSMARALPVGRSGPSGLASTTTSPRAGRGSRPDVRPASSPASPCR